MAFDYKKEYKEFYLPKNTPSVVVVPPINYIAVRGKGDPNQENGEYQAALGMLYTIVFTIKMSYKGDRRIDGYFDYVVPPLEGLWWMDGVDGIDYSRKADFNWISIIRLPDFVKPEDFFWAVQTAEKKKRQSFDKAEYLTLNEGLCVQCMHLGPYDDEPATVELMTRFAEENGYTDDFSEGRYHHEIYLGDARRCKPEKLKTVIRHPIKKSRG